MHDPFLSNQIARNECLKKNRKNICKREEIKIKHENTALRYKHLDNNFF